MPNKVHSDSKQSIDQREAAEGGARAEAGRMGGCERVWGLERIRMGGGEENSVKLLRVRTSGRQGLGPTSPHACWGCLAFRDLEEQRKKAQVQHCTALDWTGLLCFRFPAQPCYHPTPPTYQLLPDLLSFSTVRNPVFIRTQTREAFRNVAFLR